MSTRAAPTPATAAGTELRLDPAARAIADIAAGLPVVVVDDEDRENEGDLIFAAAASTDELLALTIRYSSGILCAPMSAARADRLELPRMVEHNADPMRTAFTVSVDAATGVTTGVSATDRARTLRLLAEEATGPRDLTRPGHIFPLRARPGGVLERRGHTEAAVDLMTLAGQADVGVLVELVHDDGTMMRAPALRAFADAHGLAMISIEALASHRRGTAAPTMHAATTEDTAARVLPETARTAPALEFTEAVEMPTDHGLFRALAVRETGVPGAEHLVLVRGDVTTADPVLTRVHSECVTGDVLGSRRCDCGPQLAESLDRIDRAGRGLLVLLRGHEGRGIGLVEKLRAYALQESGRDTVDANLDLGLPIDARSFTVVPAILEHLDVEQVDLLTHSPAKADALRAGGVDVAGTVDLTVHPTTENLTYLTTKRDRMGHHLVDLPEQIGENP